MSAAREGAREPEVAEASPPPAGGRVELAAVALLAAVGFGLRGFGLEGYAPTHWDEGLAWSGARWFASIGAEGHYSPTQAPPGVPALLALGAALFGGPRGALWISAVAGTLAIVLVARLGRRLGPTACPAPGVGVAAAALLAFSGVHTMYSRTLLTEELYLAFLLAALLASLRYLERPLAGRLLVVVLCVVLTQYTKYNGCLAGGPLCFVLARDALRGPDAGARRRARRHLFALLGLVAAAMAVNLAAIAQIGNLTYFLEHYGRYVGHAQGELGEILAWLAYVTPGSLLVLAALGLGVVVAEGPGRRWAIVLLAIALYASFLARYTFYMRLLVPVVGPALVLAARGLVALWNAPRAALGRLACAGLAVLVAVETARTWPRFRQTAWDGYARAAAVIAEAATDGAPVLQVAQRHVWPPGAPEMIYCGLPSARADLVLADHPEVVLVVDLHAFSKYGPRSVDAWFDDLPAEALVARVENPLGLDVVENNLDRAQLRALEGDRRLHERWLSIHVLRLPSTALAELLAEGR